MRCGCRCGASLTASQLRSHFTSCSNRPRISVKNSERTPKSTKPFRAKTLISPAAQGIPENPQVDGGFTTQTYGGSPSNGLYAMQFAIAQPIRQSAQLRQFFIEHLGRGIASLSARLL
jgi:hypothetical protein